MNVFDTKHNYSVQESLHLIATPPLSLGKVSWIFKDQDHQRSSPSEKSFFSTPPPPPPLPFNLQRNFFFPMSLRNIIIIKVPEAATPYPPLLKEQTTVWTLITFGRFETGQYWLGSWIFTVNFMFFSKSSYLGDKIHTGFLELSFEVQAAQDTHTIWVCNQRHFIIIVNALDLPFA